jgi:EXLDI family protein
MEGIMQQEVPSMPNRTIYVADADLPLFEKAQKLAGGNLSAAISEALRRFVEVQETKTSGFEEITVEVGKVAHFHKRFQGRLLAKGRVFEQHDTRKVSYNVYLTPKGNLAVYIRNTPNWNYWSGKGRKQQNWSKKSWSNEDWSQWSAEDWSHWTNDENEFRLEVYSSLEELEYNVPPEMYEAVAQILKVASDDGVEVLDI